MRSASAINPGTTEIPVINMIVNTRGRNYMFYQQTNFYPVVETYIMSMVHACIVAAAVGKKECLST